MNDTTPPPGESGPASERTSDRFFGWLRGLDIVRGRERWFAGVAGGVAAKAGIDPLIVRGIFVVLAILGGPGILLYLVGWLLLPDSSGRIHLEDLFRGRASAGVIVTVVILGALVLVPLIFSGFAGAFTGTFPWGWGAFAIFPSWMHTVLGVIWWAVILPALIIWLIIWISRAGRRDRGGAPSAPPAAAEQAETAGFAASAGSAPADADGPAAATFAERTSQQAQEWGDRVGARATEWGEQAGAWGQRVGEQAGAWGQKVGEQATEWGEQERQRYEARRLGAAHVVLTLAVALIAAGGAAVWALGGGAITGSQVPGDVNGAVIAAIIAALVVCAVSLIIAGIRGRNSGWVGFFAWCGVVALLFTAVMPWGSRVQVFGPTTVAVTGLTGSPSGLTVVAGTAHIDLGDLEEPQDFTLWVLAGSATIDLPDQLPVVVELGVLAGNISEDRNGTTLRQSGPFLGRVVGANLDGADDAEVSRITVRMLAGNVSVIGANAAPGLTGRYASSDETPERTSPMYDTQILESRS